MKSAYLVACEALAHRDLTACEVGRLLARKGYATAESSAAVARLQSQGLVSDLRTAENVVGEVQASKYRGRLAAERKLVRRGIDPATAGQALSPLDPEEDRLKARQFVASRAWKSAAQAARALLARGFDEDCVALTVEEAFATGDEP